MDTLAGTEHQDCAVNVTIQIKGIDELENKFKKFPEYCSRATKSALSSIGYFAAQELRNHIEYGGEGWAKLHPITLKLRKSRSAPPTPLFFLGRFARYNVSNDGTSVAIGLGKSGKGQPGQITGDRWLDAAVARHEFGKTVSVSRKTRRVWLSTKIKGKKYKKLGRSGAITGGYFVLKPETQHLQIPKRPMIAPVYRKIKPRIGPMFEEKFFAAMDRYMTGKGKT